MEGKGDDGGYSRTIQDEGQQGGKKEEGADKGGEEGGKVKKRYKRGG